MKYKVYSSNTKWTDKDDMVASITLILGYHMGMGLPVVLPKWVPWLQVWCYGYRVYIPYITYPFISTRTFDIESLHHSTYFLIYPFIPHSTIKTQKLLFLFTTF